MTQVRWTRIEVRKARWGYRARLIDARGAIFFRLWRPTAAWAYSAAHAWQQGYIYSR
jgi:hypothetical protein